MTRHLKWIELSRQQLGYPLTNIVYMGMGEPLLNYSAVMESIERITSPDGMAWSPKEDHCEHCRYCENDSPPR
jgi:adenine C2-methylase RlmN of 23S rRNA A2503 and tRNA A37